MIVPEILKFSCLYVYWTPMMLHVCLSGIDSEMAGRIRTKLGGRVPLGPKDGFPPGGRGGRGRRPRPQAKNAVFRLPRTHTCLDWAEIWCGVRSTLLHKWAWPKATPTCHAHLQKGRLTARRAVK